MIAITEMSANIFMPIGYSAMVKPLSGSVVDCHVAKLDMPNDKLQTFLRGMSNKVVTWHHWAVNSFLFLHKYIYGSVDINKRYENAATFSVLLR